MKTLALMLPFLILMIDLKAQSSDREKDKVRIQLLIEQYSNARETLDTASLRRILTLDIDQLVSSGEWRIGIESSIQGMLRSSTGNPGERTLTVERIRFVQSHVAIADARYQIKASSGTVRNMWSTFILLLENGSWKISAIRNMLPAN